MCPLFLNAKEHSLVRLNLTSKLSRKFASGIPQPTIMKTFWKSDDEEIRNAPETKLHFGMVHPLKMLPRLSVITHICKHTNSF